MLNFHFSPRTNKENDSFLHNLICPAWPCTCVMLYTYIHAHAISLPCSSLYAATHNAEAARHGSALFLLLSLSHPQASCFGLPSPFSDLWRSPQLLFVIPRRARSPSEGIFSQLKPLAPNCSPPDVHLLASRHRDISPHGDRNTQAPRICTFQKAFPFPSLIPVTLKKLPTATLLRGGFCNFSILKVNFGKDLKYRERRRMVLLVGVNPGLWVTFLPRHNPCVWPPEVSSSLFYVK